MTKTNLETQFTDLGKKVTDYINQLKLADQKVNISTLLVLIGIALPLSAFTYWRLLLEYFGKDYFVYCFSYDDVAYLLYDKGTYLWIIILMMAFPSIIFILFKDSKLMKAVIAATLIGGTVFILTSIGEFSTMQILVYILMFIVTNFFIFYYNKNTLYIYVIIIGLFFVTSAGNDAKKALNLPRKMSITLKSGRILLDKIDTSKVYVGSTSKFILIFDKKTQLLSRTERDSIL